MNILVIGNGFDLAHGLPTKYTDFLDFVSKFKEEEGNEAQSTLDFPDSKIKGELSDCVNDNFWIDYFLKKRLSLEKDGKENWIDFEKEISEFIKEIDSFRKNMYFSEIPDYIKHILNKKGVSESDFENNFQCLLYVKQILINSLNRLIRALEIYLTTQVQAKELDEIKCITEIKSFKEHHLGGDHKILSFNYTNIFKKLYGIYSDDSYDFIHGKADENHTVENCNMVLGIEEYLNGEDRDNDNEFIQFKKFYQRIFKKTGSKYTQWIKNPNNEKLYIYFFGHSLDPTDGDIIHSLIMAKYAETTIYYHNEAAFEQQIINLVKIIGENNLIRMTGDSEQSIKFIKIENETPV